MVMAIISNCANQSIRKYLHGVLQSLADYTNLLYFNLYFNTAYAAYTVHYIFIAVIMQTCRVRLIYRYI